MNCYRDLVCATMLILCVVTDVVAQRPLESKLEIYIPRGMPIRLDAFRDQGEETITKYTINRRVSDDVKALTMVELLVGLRGEIIRSTRYTTLRVSDSVSIAWASAVKVDRLILIVERLQTKNGVWVISAQAHKIDPRRVVSLGAKAVPRAKFIKQLSRR